MKKKVGRPTSLTDDLVAEIKDLVLLGLKDVQIYTQLAIPRRTWCAWLNENQKNFCTNILNWRRKYKLDLAEMVSEEILKAESIDKTGEINTSLIATKQRESQFIRETLGKDEYSKRSELTGKNGSALQIVVPQEIKDLLENDNSSQ